LLVVEYNDQRNVPPAYEYGIWNRKAVKLLNEMRRSLKIKKEEKGKPQDALLRSVTIVAAAEQRDQGL